jgi:polynucleotide 5'-kinase involved in rRNA processing
MDKTSFLFKIFRWIKSRFHGNYSESVKSDARDQRQEERKERMAERNRKYSKRYSGSRSYTPVPKII